MGIIVPRMDTSVGAPTARDGDRLPQLETQALLHRGLHALGVRLDLVAMVAITVVRQMDEISRHKFLFEGTKIEKNLIRNAECEMLNTFSIIQHSAFLIQHSKNHYFCAPISPI